MVRLQRLTTTPDPFFPPSLSLSTLSPQQFIAASPSCLLSCRCHSRLLSLKIPPIFWISPWSTMTLDVTRVLTNLVCVCQWKHFLSLLCCRKEKRKNRVWSHPHNIRLYDKVKSLWPRARHYSTRYFYRQNTKVAADLVHSHWDWLIGRHIETDLRFFSHWTCQRDGNVFNTDENLAAGSFRFCQQDCLIGAMRGEFTASQQRLAVFGASQQLYRAATDSSCHLTLRCLFFLSFLSSSPQLCSCACVITLPPRSPLSRHTSGCFLPSIFRFPSSPSHPSLVSSRSLRQRRTTYDASRFFYFFPSCRHVTRGSPSSKSQQAGIFGHCVAVGWQRSYSYTPVPSLGEGFRSMPKQFSLGAWPPPQRSSSSRLRLWWGPIYHPCFLCFRFTCALLRPLVIANKNNKAARKCNVTDGQEVFALMGLCWTRRYSGSSTMSAQALYKQTGQSRSRTSVQWWRWERDFSPFWKRSFIKPREKHFAIKLQKIAYIESILHGMTQNG